MTVIAVAVLYAAGFLLFLLLEDIRSKRLEAEEEAKADERRKAYLKAQYERWERRT